MKLFSLLFQEQNRNVGIKLIITTCFMFTFPIAVFYSCFHFVFQHKDIPEAWSGGAAIVAANLVLAGYIISAFNEDDDDDTKSDDNEKDKNLKDAPKVGVFKTRTD